MQKFNVIDEEDEEYQKRLERARQIRHSMGIVTPRELNNTDEEMDRQDINLSNNNISFSNNPTNISSPETTEYQQRLERARQIRHSMGIITPRELSNTYIDTEDSEAEQRIKQKMDELWVDTDDISANDEQQENDEISAKRKEAVNVIMNGNKPNNLMTEEEKLQDQYKKEETLKNIQEANTDKNILSQIGKAIENAWLGAWGGVKSLVYYAGDPNHTKQQESNLFAGNTDRNVAKELYKAGLKEDEAQMIKDAQGKAPIFLMSERVKKPNIIPTLSEETKSNIEDTLNENKDAFGEIELNPIKRDISKSLTEDQKKIASNINKIDNPIMKKIAELSPSVGNSLAGAGLSVIDPGLGMSYFMMSAAGSYEFEGRNRGMTKEEARTYGTIMGYAEGATEMFEINAFLKAGSSLRQGAFKQALKNYGIDMADNAIQEAIIDPIDELTAYTTSGKTKNDYSTKEGWEQLSRDMIEDGFNGALSSLLMNGVGMSIDSSVYIYDKIKNGKTVTKQDVKNALSDIQKSGKINIKEKFKEAFDFQKEKLKNNNEDVYTITRTDNEGNIVRLEQAMGEKIDLDNSDLQINPAVVYINGAYNIIDSQSGVVIDSTMYGSKETATNKFKEKIANIDEATANKINEQTVITQLSLFDKFQEIVEKANQNPEELQRQARIEFVQDDKLYSNQEAQEILNNYNVEDTVYNRPYTGQELNDKITQQLFNKASQNIQETAIQSSNTQTQRESNSSYINTQEQLDKFKKDIKQISDKSVHGKNYATNVLQAVADKIENVEVIEQSGMTFVNSLDKDGRVAHQQKISSNVYTGAKIKQMVNEAINHADMSNIDSSQTSTNQNTDTLQSSQTSYTPEKVKTITEPFNKQQEYTKEEMAEVWNNEIDSKDLQNIYDDKGNSQGYVSIEQDGDNLIVKNYDDNDNVIASEVIRAKKNGKYSSRAITNAINKVTGVNTKVQKNQTNNVQQSTKNQTNDVEQSTEGNEKNVQADVENNTQNVKLEKYIQEMAVNFQDDLANTLPGKRYKAGDTWTGQKRSTTKELAEIKDETGATWDKIGQVLEDIAENRENKTKLARLLREKIDEALSDGYTNIYGQTIMPNEEYLVEKGKIDGKDYLAERTNDDTSYYFSDEDSRIFGMRKERKNNKLEKTGNIKYNDKGITLGKKEYVGVVNAINTDHPNLSTGINYKCYGDYFYIFDKLDFNNYVFKGKIKIIDNEQIINKIMKEVDNNDRTTRSINRLFEVSKNGQTVYSSNNINVRNTKTTTGNGRLSSKSIQTDQKTSNTRTTNIEKSNGNNQSGGLRGRGELITDNQGRQLSKQQQEFFKDSKVRDEKGNLLTVYHGTTSEFNVFNYDKLGKNTSSLGAGFYFTDRKETGEEYSRKSGNLKEVYLDIKKPMGYMQTLMTKNEYEKFIKAVDKETNGTYLEDYDGLDNALMEYNYGGDDIDLVNAVHGASGLTWKKTYELLRETTGFDGIISEEGFLNNGEKLYVTFNSNQIKNVDNINPTSNPDIRYMKKSTSNKANTRTQVAVDENIQKELHNRIQNAIISKNSRKNTFLGKVTQKVANTVKRLYGIDVSGRNHIISDYDIRHMINQHGNTTIEKTKGQIAITTKDIERIPDIINNYDKIEKGSINTNSITGENSNSIRYIKQYKGNISYVVEVVPNTGNTLQIKTMWKKSVNTNKKKPIGLSHDNKILPYTSETKSKSASNISIPQNQQNVKNNDVVFKNTYRSNNTNNTTDKTKLNAEREGAYIEQEIKKVTANESWDDTIPVTKLTDIRKTIEDYLGLGIKKGYFRQHAYAIYKGNRDVIRTREYKDIDSILHETGHALDIGNRLKIDKESIADELLTAIDKLGGYEKETRSVRLEEGFAEVIREYSVIPKQAKVDYPQTVAVLEKLRQSDKSFDKFITKVQQQTYNYIHQNPQKRDHSNQSIGQQTDKTPLSKERIKQQAMTMIWDDNYVLKSAVNTFQKVSGKTVNQLNASDNAYLLTRLMSGIGDKVSSMLADGYIDENGNKLMPGLNKIGEILGNDASRFNDLRDYLVAKRDTEYKKKRLKTGIRTFDSNYVIEKFQNDSQIQEATQIIYDTLDGVMQYAVNNGLISQETATKLKESNAFYVPMQRVVENTIGNQIGTKGAVKDIIKRRTGSELDIKDVLENIIANSTNIIRQVENNNALRALYRQGEASGLTGVIYDPIDPPMTKIGTAKLNIWKNELERQGIDTTELDLEKSIDLFAPDNKIDRQHLITSFIDDKGDRVYLQFNDKMLFNSLMGLDKDSWGYLLKFSNHMNMPLRYGATMANIGFAVPNMISDTVQATIFSTAGFIPVVDNAIGVLDILAVNNKTVRNFLNQVAPGYADKINKLYTIYQQTGATSATRLSQYRKSTQNIMKDIYGTKKSENLDIKESFKPLKRLLDIMTYIPELSEQSTRFRVFQRNYDYYKNKGNSEMDARILAAMESRDATQDFSRTGSVSREINQLIPFSAARVGSVYTFAEKVKANPKRVTTRMALLMVLAMGIRALGYDDDEIEELNQRKKDDNFIFKIGDNIVTIKKPQGILRSMINLTEYIQDLATGHIEEGKEGERLSEWIMNSFKDNLPADNHLAAIGSIPLIGGLAENKANKDFYYNTDIVKSYDLELPDSQQYYEYNSQLAIGLGQIFNYSPAKIDNLISSYFGGLGTQITNAMDYAMGKMGMTAEKPEMGAESDAVGKRFIVNVNSNSASVDEIYNRKTELTKKKNGETITDEEAEELETITNAVSNMSKLNKQIKEIKKDLSMSGKEKADEIKLLQQQKTDIARQALGKSLIHPENEQKIQSTQFYPTNSSLSKNNYELQLTSEMKTEYEQIASEYYSKYESQGIYNEEKLKDIKSKAKEYAKSQLFKKYKSELVRTKKK